MLIPKRFEEAKEVLLTCIRDIKYGLVPNGYSGYDNRPLYNSADSSLLLFQAIQKYLEYTSDFNFIKNEIYPKLKNIIKAYQGKIDIDNNNIYLDTDYLLSSGTEKTQNTWMDAKCGDIVATPRNGKTVELNSLWYNALKIMEELSMLFETNDISKEYKKLADKCKKSFREKFYNSNKKCLYDVLGDSKIRPNQLFALSLKFPIIDPASQIGKQILCTVDKKLRTPYGLKSLAKGEENYVEVYEGNNFKRDMSYHQGITWPWLLGLYFDSLNNAIKSAKNKAERQEFEICKAKLVQEVGEVFGRAIYEDTAIRLYIRIV